MKSIKFCMFACNSNNPIEIVKFLKGKTNLLIAIKFADFVVASYKNRLTVVKSNLNQYKAWDALSFDELNKLRNQFNVSEVVNDKDFDNYIAKIDVGANPKKLSNVEEKPIFKTPYLLSCVICRLSDDGIKRYLDSLHYILSALESSDSSIDLIITQANKAKFMNNINKYLFISKDQTKQLNTLVNLDYQKLNDKGAKVLFGNSLMGFIVLEDGSIELAYCTLGEKRKGDFADHPLIRLLDSGFHLPT